MVEHGFHNPAVVGSNPAPASQVMEKYFTDKKNIIHYSQLNNKHEPYAACFPTSLAMAMRNNGFQWPSPLIRSDMALDDYLYELANSEPYRILASKASIPDHAKLHQFSFIMQAVANDLFMVQGIKLIARRVPYNIAEVRSHIDAGRMLIAGTYFTRSGHMVCISGYTDDSVILNDPYGNVNDLYYFRDSNRLDDGNCVILDRKYLYDISFLIGFYPA